MVEFNDLASTPTEYDGVGRGCYSEILSDATPINIKYLESYIDSIIAQGKKMFIDIVMIPSNST